MTDYSELIAEAKNFWQDTEKSGYAPFDQNVRIRYWRDGWQTDAQRVQFDADVADWERAHGHDVRLKCYSEFQCAAIEMHAEDLVRRLSDALEARVLQLREDDRFIAYNIVNQLADMYSERIPSRDWVEVRQATNDTADEFVLDLISRSHLPRVVESVEELEALPTWAVVIAADDEVYRLRPVKFGNQSTDIRWVGLGWEGVFTERDIALPAHVLFTSDSPTREDKN